MHPYALPWPVLHIGARTPTIYRQQCGEASYDVNPGAALGRQPLVNIVMQGGLAETCNSIFNCMAPIA